MAKVQEPTLEELLDRLHQGDRQAAEAIYQTCEPLLRLVVRRQLDSALRAKLDSQDVVQSVWVGLLHEFQAGGRRFSSAEHLRAYLLRATRNRLIDRYRQHRAALHCEQRLAESEVDQLPGAILGPARRHRPGKPGSRSSRCALLTSRPSLTCAARA